MAKKKSKDHAEHNEKACNYLDLIPDYPDWVITTCFYSSLHYLEHKIFPVKVLVDVKKKTYMKVEDFDHYHSIQQQKKRMGRHDRFTELVEEKCPSDIAAHYSKLKDLSFSARYASYNYGTDIVSHAKVKLAAIKAHCI